MGEFDVRVEADIDHAIGGEDRANNIATWHFKNPTADVDRWVSIGPRLITSGLGAGGILRSIAMDRNQRFTIYVASETAGIWKSIDAGGTWQPIADSLPTLAIAGLAIAPPNPATVFASTADAGVFRSDDGGGMWRALPNSPNSEARWGVLLVSPRDAGRIYMTAADGIYRSTDGGTSWSRVLKAGRATDLVMNNGNPAILYAAIFGDGVYQTVNGGDTWTRLGKGLPPPGGSQITLAICRNQPASLYAGFSMPGGLQLFRSDDNGANWTKKNTPNDSTLYNDDIGVDGEDPNFVFVTGVDFWRSSDGGSSFTKVSESNGPHTDHHAFFPTSPSHK